MKGLDGTIRIDTGNFEAAILLFAKTSAANAEIEGMKVCGQHTDAQFYECQKTIEAAIKEFNESSVRCKCAACGKPILKQAPVLEYAGAEVCERCFANFEAEARAER